MESFSFELAENRIGDSRGTLKSASSVGSADAKDPLLAINGASGARSIHSENWVNPIDGGLLVANVATVFRATRWRTGCAEMCLIATDVPQIDVSVDLRVGSRPEEILLAVEARVAADQTCGSSRITPGNQEKLGAGATDLKVWDA